MNKYIFSSLFIVAVLAVSGCTLAPSTPQAGQNKTYTLSKSIWKSADSAKTWEAKNKSRDSLLTSNLDVLSIAINPTNSQNILVGLKSGGFIKTENGGDTWQKTNFVSEKVYGLAFDPGNSKIIYASGVWQNRGKIFKSEDSGENWKEIYTAAQNGPFVISLKIDGKNSKTIYATTSDNQAIKSEDAGASWKNIYQSNSSLQANSPILKLDIDKTNNQLIYAVTQSGQVLRSKDGGGTFEDIGKNVNTSIGNIYAYGQNFSYVETDPQNSGWVYLSGKGGIMRSKNSGDTWEKVVTLNDPSKAPITALAINPKNSQELIYGAGQAAYISVDGGTNWTTSQFDTTQTFSILKYDPINTQTIYAGFRKQ